jgi:hypothetical protein
MTAIVLSELSKISSVQVNFRQYPQLQKGKFEIHTGTKVAIRSACLDLCYIFLSQAKLLVEPEDVLSDRYRGHTIRIVRDAAETRSTLARRERLPPRVCTARASVDCNQLECSTIQEQKVHVRAAQSIISAVPSEKCTVSTSLTK